MCEHVLVCVCWRARTTRECVCVTVKRSRCAPSSDAIAGPLRQHNTHRQISLRLLLVARSSANKTVCCVRVRVTQQNTHAHAALWWSPLPFVGVIYNVCVFVFCASASSPEPPRTNERIFTDSSSCTTEISTRINYAHRAFCRRCPA